MLQRGQQYFPIAWIVRGFQIMNNTSAREEQAFALLDSFRFQGVQSYATAGGSPGLCQFDLRLDRLTFPTSSHNSLLHNRLPWVVGQFEDLARALLRAAFALFGTQLGRRIIHGVHTSVNAARRSACATSLQTDPLPRLIPGAGLLTDPLSRRGEPGCSWRPGPRRRAGLRRRRRS